MKSRESAARAIEMDFAKIENSRVLPPLIGLGVIIAGVGVLELE